MFEPFDVVVVPFPYSDVLAEKRRPAIVVSTADMQQEAGLIWVAMVTSAPGVSRLGDHVVEDLDASGLTVPCRVRASKIATLDQDRVLRRLGQLSAVDTEGVRAALGVCAAF